MFEQLQRRIIRRRSDADWLSNADWWPLTASFSMRESYARWLTFGETQKIKRQKPYLRREMRTQSKWSVSLLPSHVIASTLLQ